MEKISLNTLFKLNKLIDDVEDDELALFLDKISQNFTKEALEDASDEVVLLYNYISEVKNTIGQLVESALISENADRGKILTNQGNVEKALQNFMSDLTNMMTTDQEKGAKDMAEQVDQMTSPFGTSNIQGFR